MSLFLTSDELIELTGYTQQGAQVRWLKRNGVRFFRQRHTGAPRVLREALSERRGGELEGPRLDWIRNGRKAA